jgi:FHS family glucose/mannose:H+ symporter-like MFS transporter
VRSGAAVALLYGGFLFTGAMAVLLGAILPRAAALYRLHDVQSGTLLTIEYATSACGALLVRRRFRRSLTTGYALMALGPALLLMVHGYLAAASIGVFGLGLGMAMTSTSLIIGWIYPATRGSALSTLNFVWSIGATACPLAIAHWSGTLSLGALCPAIAGISAVLAILAGTIRLPAWENSRAAAAGTAAPATPMIVLFAAIAFLYVGVEATVGGWISTYTMRVTLWQFTGGTLAAGCFWGALLAGRGLTPLVLRRVPEKTVHAAATLAGSLGILLLVLTRGGPTLVTAALWAGLALGPIYPLTISLFIGRAGDTRNAGWVFAMAGFGGAVLPWLTGLLSSSTHSLRLGLLVALFAAGAMAILTLRIPKGAPAPVQASAG